MIERSYPAVYLEEVAFNAKPIDGVPTAQSGTGVPAWTDANAHDPGMTLPGLLRFLAEPLWVHAELGRGTVDGLAVEAADSAHAPAVRVSEGVALDCAGREVATDLSALVSRYIGATEQHLSGTGAAPASGAVRQYDESQSLLGDWP
jgi:hypothetical protein